MPGSVEDSAINAVGDKIDLMVDAVRGHPFAHQIVGDSAGVRHQPVAVPVIFQIIEPAKSGDMGNACSRCHAGCPVHPAENDSGAAFAYGGGKLAFVEHGHQRGEGAALCRHPGGGKPVHASRIRLDHHGLCHASCRKRGCQTFEEQFGPALRCPGHRLEQPQAACGSWRIWCVGMRFRSARQGVSLSRC